LRYDYVRTWFTRLDDADLAAMERVYGDLEAMGREAIGSAAVKPEKVTVKRAADMRYVGQEHAVTVGLPIEVFVEQDAAASRRSSDAITERPHGTPAPAGPAEILTLRTTGPGVRRKPPQEKIAAGDAEPRAAAHTGKRPVYFGEGFIDTPTFARGGLLAG